MSARVGVLTAVLALATLLTIPAPPPASVGGAAAARKHCPALSKGTPRPGQRRVAIDRDSRLVRTLLIGDLDTARLYSCFKRSGRLTKLGRSDGVHQAASFNLAGRFVAFARYTTPADGEAVSNFYVLDARAGKVTFALP